MELQLTSGCAWSSYTYTYTSRAPPPLPARGWCVDGARPADSRKARDGRLEESRGNE